MTESKGPGTKGGSAAPNKKRKGPVARLRPYAVGVTAMAVVFGVSALIGAHVRAGKDDKVTPPGGVVAAATKPTAPPPAPDATATPTPSATPAGPKLGIPVRPTVPVTVTVYEDLRSPASKAFQDQYGATIQQLLASGQVQFQYHLVTASDKEYGGKGSQVAANAAACAQDQGRFVAFVDELWKVQPADPKDDALASEKLMEKLAHKAHKIKAGTFEPCVEQRDHEGWVIKSQQDFAASGLGAAPALEINGEPVKDAKTLTPATLRSQIDAEIKRVVALDSTPAAG
ncbi:DsbA family protein [Streptomyces sp. NPDC021020]|uniref:DsbA family protein n=1 Tax=Streptomyces sp. NPDC021020 TaxID=3365109 RepID=UPI003788C544